MTNTNNFLNIAADMSSKKLRKWRIVSDAGSGMSCDFQACFVIIKGIDSDQVMNVNAENTN